MSMNKWSRFAGIVGAVILLFGLVGGIAIGSFTQVLIAAHLGTGALLILIWFLVSGVKNLGQAGQAISGRASRFSLNLTFYTAIFLGLLVAVNWLASQHNRSWDTTEEGVYSLSRESVEVIRNLKEPLKIVSVLGAEIADRQDLNEFFGRYRDQNRSRVSLDIIDPRSEPHLLDHYEIRPGNVVYLQYGEGDNSSVVRLNERTEEAVTNAIIKLTRGAARNIYYVVGHDQPSLESDEPTGLKEFASALKDAHLSMSPLFLGERAEIPSDASAVILAAPKRSMLPEERQLLLDYVDGGGSLLMLSNPQTSGDIKMLAQEFGLKVGDNVVIDQIQRLFSGPSLGAQPVVRDYVSHPITRNMSENDITIFNIASTVSALENDTLSEESDKITRTELLYSSPTAWAETNLEALFDPEQPVAILEDDDIMGPVPLAAVYEKKLDAVAGDEENSIDASFKKASRVVVFGDLDWMLNANINVYANRDLLLNTVSWLVGEEGGVIIGTGSLRASFAPIPRNTFMLILTSSFIVPELILILGFFIWWRRKAISV